MMRTLSWCLLSGVFWKCPGELSSEVLSSLFYRCSSGIPESSTPTLKISFMQFVGEITSMPPSTGAGVQEYRHNLYNGCFSKVEVDGFRSFSWLCVEGWIQLDVGFASLGVILCFPCVPNT